MGGGPCIPHPGNDWCGKGNPVKDVVDKTVNVSKDVVDKTVDVGKNVGDKALDVVDTVIVDPVVNAGKHVDQVTGAGEAAQDIGEKIKDITDMPGLVNDVAQGQAERAAKDRFDKMQKSRESAAELKARRAQRLYGKNRGGNGTLLTGPLGVQGSADIRKKTLLGQ